MQTPISLLTPTPSPKRLDGELFYASKHVEDGENACMVGSVLPDVEK